MTSPAQLSAMLKSEGQRLGMDLVGIAPAVTPTGISRLQSWIERGFAGEMHYIPRRATAYEHPEHVLPGVRSVVMVAVNYKGAGERGSAGVREQGREDRGDSAADLPHPQTPALPGRIASYAQSRSDYHDVLKPRLQQLADVLHAAAPSCRTRCVVDTAPLLERDFARLAGLGWFGKNTMLISKRLGSFVFLAALLTDADLEPDAPHATSHCGTCTRCLEVCPTDAFPEPGVLDARKCISYLTIELKGPIPLDLRTGVGEWLFGCDLCQDVCPWNRKSPPATDATFAPLPELASLDALEILRASDADLRTRFRESPLARPGPAGLKRNAAVVAGNLGDDAAIPVLCETLNHVDPVVRGASAWALGCLGGTAAQEALNTRRQFEDNPDVIVELESAASRFIS